MPILTDSLAGSYCTPSNIIEFSATALYVLASWYRHIESKILTANMPTVHFHSRGTKVRAPQGGETRSEPQPREAWRRTHMLVGIYPKMVAPSRHPACVANLALDP